MDTRYLRVTLHQAGDGYSAFLQIRSASVFAILAPVIIEDRADGAILTCHKMKRKLTAEQESREKRRSSGVIALGRFSDILQESAAMEACVHQAKLYALSELPVLIEGEAGTEKRLIAQSIHNAGLRSRSGFADISCAGLGEEEQYALIFGEHGAAVQANGGTILLEDADWLTPANQYRLLQLIRYKLRWEREIIQNKHVDVRIMVSGQKPGSLFALVQEGKFREDLYYLLQGLLLKIPPLRLRQEDLQRKLQYSIRESCEKYDRYHVLSPEAMEFLLSCAGREICFRLRIIVSV